MKLRIRLTSFSLLAACLLIPTIASSEKPEKGKAGGNAKDHRSERAEERSNAQWQEGATRGQDRADEVRNQPDDSEKAQDKHAKKRHKKNADERAERDADSESESKKGPEDRRDEGSESQKGRGDQDRSERDENPRDEAPEADGDVREVE